MKCNEIDYISFREGLYDSETMKAVKKHLNECKKCRKEFGKNEAILNGFREYWIDSGEVCLSGDQLQNYVSGKITKKERMAVERHLSVCSQCRREIEVFKEISIGKFRVLSMENELSLSDKQVLGHTPISNTAPPALESPQETLAGFTSGRPLISRDFLKTKRPAGRKEKALSPARFIKKLESDLKTEIVHQDHVIATLISAVKSSKWGLRDQQKPRGVFLFMGPPGTGKTFIAKKFAAHLFGDPTYLVQENLEYYNSASDVARLFGAAPGYIGYSDGNDFLSRVKKAGEGVILLDEIEKANPIIRDSLLGILDEGKARNAAGEEVDFSNFFIIMTTNAGAELSSASTKIGFVSEKERLRSCEEIKSLLKKTYLFRPEFLSRICDDHFCLFNPLTAEIVEKLVSLEISKLKKLLKQTESKKLSFTKTFIKEFSRCVSHEIDARQVFRSIDILIKRPIMDIKIDNGKRWKKAKEIRLTASTGTGKGEFLNICLAEMASNIGTALKKKFPFAKIVDLKNPAAVSKCMADAAILDMSLFENKEMDLFKILEKLKNRAHETELIIIAHKDMGQDFVLRCIKENFVHYIPIDSLKKELPEIMVKISECKRERLSKSHQSGTYSIKAEGSVLRYLFTPGPD